MKLTGRNSFVIGPLAVKLNESSTDRYDRASRRRGLVAMADYNRCTPCINRHDEGVPGFNRNGMMPVTNDTPTARIGRNR
jgi:hypothetical protein